MSRGRVYDKCEFARLLERVYKLPRSEIKKWVCIAEFESSFNTEAINTQNTDGSTDYGIFQINNRYWCADGYGGSNGCGIPCSSLLGSDITNSVNCAQIVRSRHGFDAWVAYNNNCQSKNLDQYMAECWNN